MKLRKLAIGGAVFGAAAVVAAGVAFATIPDGSGVIHGCFKTAASTNGTNKLAVIDTDQVSACPSGYAALNWNPIKVAEGYHDGLVPFSSSTTVLSGIVVAGSYDIRVTFEVSNGSSSPASDHCTLIGPGDYRAYGQASIVPGGVETLAIQTVATSSSPGVITLTCHDDSGVGSQNALDIRLIFTWATSVSATAL